MTDAKKKSIITALENLDSSTLISVWNEYCSEHGDMDDYIYDNDEYTLNEMFQTIDEALRAVCFGEYRYNDEYFIFNGYGNLESFDRYNVGEHIYLSDLADFIVDYGCDELSEDDDIMEGITEDFLYYANGKFNDVDFTEDDIPYGTDLIDEDWDEVVEDMREEFLDKFEDE